MHAFLLAQSSLVVAAAYEDPVVTGAWIKLESTCSSQKALETACARLSSKAGRRSFGAGAGVPEQLAARTEHTQSRGRGA